MPQVERGRAQGLPGTRYTFANAGLTSNGWRRRISKARKFVIADVTIRLAVPADAQPIALMSRDLIEHDLPWGWQAGRVARKILSPNTNVVAVGPEGSPEAFGIMEYWDDDAHLVLFAVQATRQRRGIGSAMLLWLEAVARANGSERIRVESRRENVAARHFYNEHGYHEQTIDRAMYGKTVDGIRLEKWLRAEPKEN